MKTTITFFCLFLIFPFNTYPQECPSIQEYTQVFGEDSLPKRESAHKIIQTQDGGFLLVGSWNEQQAFLLKLCSRGDSLWQKNYRYGSSTVFNDLREDENGDLIIAGSCEGCSVDSVSKILILKSDSTGNILSNTTYGTPNKAAWGINMSNTIDGGFVVTGRTQRGGAFAGNSVHLYKFTSEGFYQWHQFYDKLYFDSGLGAIQTSDLGYAIVGTSNQSGLGKFATWFKTDSLGEQLWSRKMNINPDNTSKPNDAKSIRQLSNGHLIVTGTMYIDSTKGNELYVVEIDVKNGDTLRFKTFGNQYEDHGNDLHLLENGHIMIGGSQGVWASFNNAWMLIVDGNFQEIASYSYNLALYDEAASMIPISSDGSRFAFCGNRRYFGIGVDAIFGLRDSPPCLNSLTQFPQNNQLYARDLINSLAVVPASGTLYDSSYTYQEMRLKFSKNDSTLISTFNYPLTYSNNQAFFSFEPQIPAELVNYRFDLYGFDGKCEHLEASAIDVVAGDTYLIQGQSNAVASATISEELTNEMNQSSFVRVFGSGKAAYEEAWFIGDGDVGPSENGNVGQWGLRLARNIVEEQGVPIAVFNGAKSGSHLRQHLPKETNRYDTTSIYGRMLKRVEQTNLKESIRAIIFFQGETDGWFAALDSTGSVNHTDRYKTNFFKLYEAWQEDFDFEKSYIFQIRPGCFVGPFWGGVDLEENTLGNLEIMEAQRQIAEELPQMEIMSTTAVIHDGCHYPYTGGYELLGDRMYQLIARDLYNSEDTLNIEPPAIESAELREDSTVVLTFKNPYDDLIWQDGAERDFILHQTEDSIVGGRIDDHELILQLSGNSADLNSISYAGHIRTDNPFVTNADGVGILGFLEFAIKNTVNIESTINDFKIKLYPNPIKDGWVRLSIENEDMKEVEVKLFNGQGKLVLLDKFILNNSGNHDLSLSQPSGLYYMELIAKEQILKVFKIIIE